MSSTLSSSIVGKGKPTSNCESPSPLLLLGGGGTSFVAMPIYVSSSASAQPHRVTIEMKLKTTQQGDEEKEKEKKEKGSVTDGDQQVIITGRDIYNAVFDAVNNNNNNNNNNTTSLRIFLPKGRGTISFSSQSNNNNKMSFSHADLVSIANEGGLKVIVVNTASSKSKNMMFANVSTRSDVVRSLGLFIADAIVVTKVLVPDFLRTMFSTRYDRCVLSGEGKN
eukprot:PhM_4_TR9394/c0_g1_i2/m.65221